MPSWFEIFKWWLHAKLARNILSRTKGWNDLKCQCCFICWYYISYCLICMNIIIFCGLKDLLTCSFSLLVCNVSLYTLCIFIVKLTDKLRGQKKFINWKLFILVQFFGNWFNYIILWKPHTCILCNGIGHNSKYWSQFPLVYFFISGSIY